MSALSRWMGLDILVFAWDNSGRAAADQILAEPLPHPASLLVCDSRLMDAFIGRIAEPNVIGCILILTREAIADPRLSSIVSACQEAMTLRQDFRLFVRLKGLSLEDLQQMALEFGAVADIIDSVHLAEYGGHPPDLAQTVHNHLADLERIWDVVRYQRLKRLAMRAAAFVHVLFIASWGVGWAYWSFRPSAAMSGPWAPFLLVVLGVLFSASLLALLANGLGWQTAGMLRMGSIVFPVWVARVTSPTVMLRQWRFIIAGLFLGLLLDASRRMLAGEKRRSARLEGPEECALPAAIGRPGWTFLANAPILGAGSRIFLSYSRSSEWGREVARDLHREFARLRIVSFLDTEEIPVGSSWRHRLQDALGCCTVFIALYDQHTAERHWPLAELVAACKGQAYAAQPSIIIIKHPGLDVSSIPGKPGALLRQVLANDGRINPALLRIISFGPYTTKHVVQGIRDANFSLVGPDLSGILTFLLGPLRIAGGSVGPFGTMVGWLILFVWLILHMCHVRSPDWASSATLVYLGVLLLAYWVGFVARLAIASRFELKETQEIVRTQVAIQLGAVWGLCGVLTYLLRVRFDPFLLVSAVISVGYGYIAGADFILVGLSVAGKYKHPDLQGEK